MKSIRIALAQINPSVGDISGNAEKIISFVNKARDKNVDIIAFPELAVTGYPPEDLLYKPQFIADNIMALKNISEAANGISAIVGYADRNKHLYNAAAVISGGRLVDSYYKKHLPNYGVFDEQRYFSPGKRYSVYNLEGIRIGVNICEDIWYAEGPAMVQAVAGAELIININASPYRLGHALNREEHVSAMARQCGASIAYVNMVGGQDELVFDGGSFFTDREGKITARGNYFVEEMIIADIEIESLCSDGLTAAQKSALKPLVGPGEIVDTFSLTGVSLRTQVKGVKNRKYKKMPVSENVYTALVTGTRDYVLKNGFSEVVIGMSGGIDSALVAAVAVDALGKDRVHGVFMPSEYTSQESRTDAEATAGNLGIVMEEISITSVFAAYHKTLAGSFRGLKPDITEENLQARIRGNLLMALSNKFGWIVLTTGNKSEMSVGYATLYGDMAGGFAVIKDIPKTMVYELCEWRNNCGEGEIIPKNVLSKEPTAELRPDQLDTDSLPPYPVLDPILKAYVEEDRHYDEIRDMGCEVECVERVLGMVDRSEYKRRQAPPGIKITSRAFGRDRRMPVTNKYRNY
ncbi:MAG: NAD+ synthase [Nitrospira sp.]|nr:NAD+ synthase [Nitrospira sp.]